MSKFSVLLWVALALVGVVNSARADGPPAAQIDPPAAQVGPPAAICDCEPCICPPGTCTCAKCGLGCKGRSGGASAQGMEEVTYSVGMVDTAQVQAFTASQPVAPAGYKWVCDGNQCRLVPTGAVAMANPPAALVAGNTCPTCGMVMTAEQADKANRNLTAAAAPVTYAAPRVTYTSAPMMTYTSGDCASCNSSGSMMMGSYGGGYMTSAPVRRGLFGRRRGGGGCGG